MRPEQFCTESVTVRGAVYLCGRRKGHDAPGSTAKDPQCHQCLGLDHPGDGLTYMLSWYGPMLMEAG